MTSDFQKRQADWAKKEQVKEDKERIDEVKVGEIFGKATGDIGNTDELKIRIDDVEMLRLKPSFNFIKDDSIKIIMLIFWKVKLFYLSRPKPYFFLDKTKIFMYTLNILNFLVN